MTPREIRSQLETVTAAAIAHKNATSRGEPMADSFKYCVWDAIVDCLMHAHAELTVGFNLDNDYSDVIAPAGWERVEV